MNSILLALALALFPGQTSDTPRRPHPLAPSLPVLTKEEYAAFDRIIDRFILYDTKKLTGAEGRKALADLNDLGPEAIFSLIEGFNRAANMEHSCPAVVIGRKIAKLLAASEDIELLTFAKENIGAGVKAKRHMGTVKDLQLGAQLRRAALQRAGATGLVSKAPRSMNTDELINAAAKERGMPLKNILRELEKRDDPKVLHPLKKAAASGDKEIRELARGLLAKNLTRQKPEELKAGLKDKSPEMRVAAAQAVAAKKLRWVPELIELLDDTDREVRQATHLALRTVSGGADYGPSADATPEQRAASIRQWREWWNRQPAP